MSLRLALLLLAATALMPLRSTPAGLPLGAAAAGAQGLIDAPIPCDGRTDAAPALQAIADQMHPGGPGRLVLPPGECRIASPVVFHQAVTLQGDGYTEGAGGGMGTWIVVDRTGFTPFTFQGQLSRGSVVRDLGVREMQPSPGPDGWTPADYDFVFRVQDALGEVAFDRVLFAGVTRGIYANASGRIDVRDVSGQVYRTGIEIDGCLDIGRIGYAHFWPFVTSDQRVLDYQERNLDAVVLRRVDGIFIGDLFSLGSRSVLRLTRGKQGVTTKAYVSNLYADFTRYGIWIDGDGSTLQVANITTQHDGFGLNGRPIPGSTGLFVDAGNTVVQAGNWRTDLADRSAVVVHGGNNHVMLGSLWVHGWNHGHDGGPALDVTDSGTAPPNQLELATTPLLTDGNGGPVRGGGNALVREAAMMNVPARP